MALDEDMVCVVEVVAAVEVAVATSVVEYVDAVLVSSELVGALEAEVSVASTVVVLSVGVASAELVDKVITSVDVAAEVLVEVAAGGGMTLRLTVAPHRLRGVPFGQHPALVQYQPAGQYSSSRLAVNQ